MGRREVERGCGLLGEELEIWVSELELNVRSVNLFLEV